MAIIRMYTCRLSKMLQIRNVTFTHYRRNDLKSYRDLSDVKKGTQSNQP